MVAVPAQLWDRGLSRAGTDTEGWIPQFSIPVLTGVAVVGQAQLGARGALVALGPQRWQGQVRLCPRRPDVDGGLGPAPAVRVSLVPVLLPVGTWGDTESRWDPPQITPGAASPSRALRR